MAAIDGASDPVFDPKATTLPVLRYLVALADRKHFGRAAAACGVSQPTLSAQISQWESRMGVQAFARTGAGVAATPVGERVVAEARNALAALAALEGAAASATPPFYGPVRLGVIPTIGPYALPIIAPAIESRWPDLELPITEGLTGELLDRLDRGRIDAAMLALLPGMEATREHEVLYDEPFLVAAPAGSALAAKDRVAPRELADQRLLLLDDGHCLRDQALEVCRLRDRDRRPGADYRATSLETLRSLVALGKGVTILPELAARTAADDPRVAIRPLSGARADRRIVLCWRRGDPRGDAYRQLGSAIRVAVKATGIGKR